jgi:16S rRNA (uracil1498-N3)-methyltransferase
MHQLFVDQLPREGGLVTLQGDEEHYLSRALRARPGELLRLASADGSAAVAVLESYSGGSALLRVQREDPDPAPALDIALDLCPPKGEALDSALEMAVQLGVGRLRMVRSERTMASWGRGPLDPGRLARCLREAARQCLRAVVPPLDAALPLDEALRGAAGETLLIMSERGGEALAAAGLAGAGRLRVLVGPEGGFTAGELEAARQNAWRAMSLGPRPLKTATAVAASLAVLNALCTPRSGRTLEP